MLEVTPARLSSFALRLEHEFFDGPFRGIVLHPDPGSQEQLERYGLAARAREDGLLLGFPPDSMVAPTATRDEMTLRFLGHATDPGIALYTPQVPRKMGDVLRVQVRLGRSGEPSLQIVPWPSGVPVLPQNRRGTVARPSQRPPLVVLDLTTTEAELLDAGLRDSWECHEALLRLRTRELHWKYTVVGMSAGDVEILDLSPDRAARTELLPATPPTGLDGTAFITERPLPLRERAENRFQLRARDGRVLIRRLPNARPDTVGKERLRDGREVPVAETFINP